MSAAVKVVHLSSVHQASDTRIFVKECRSLAAAGYDVTLIARADRDQRIDGVKIRAVSALSGSRLRRMTSTVLEVYRKAVEADGDVYHFHDPELLPIGLLLKLRGKRVIYDVHENVSKQIQSKYWIPPILRTPVSTGFRVIERLSSLSFDAVVAATPGIARQFPPEKTVVVQNFALMDEFASIFTSDYENRSASVAYVGGITRVRGIKEMVDAMDLLETDATLLLGGAFNPPELESEMEARFGYRHVEFRGWLDRDGVRTVLSQARMGLLLLHPEPNYLDSYPVKLFEYMAAGLPVIASDFPFWEQFVKDTGSGIMVNPLNPCDISSAMQWLFDHPAESLDMGRRGREAVLTSYSWEREAVKLISAYSKVG